MIAIKFQCWYTFMNCVSIFDNVHEFLGLMENDLPTMDYDDMETREKSLITI